ncbi:LysR substrate-binding domain-containing protein [Chelatococcus reniformis]|uniref:Transcriptional regulator n=1 Tax=Chelatococcus reniformis TaxID=1494448 RepID=A0A916XJR5_9HYPH|nr:LysR substrate-binding domain-containing protein [Chelatococcus reniformis]GGC77171.1 transcriptional regulator [Chelatococcus reniformis]
MALRLPPLPALRFFEAAGRHKSFKLAAAELNVTPSAVSHGIVGLEQALGVTLFARNGRTLSLTAAGADYLPYVAEALSLIAIGTQRLPAGRGARALAVSCAPTLAARWLLPRLQRFQSRWPQVGVTVDTSHRQVGFPVDGFDFAIRLSRAPAVGARWTRLFGQRLIPVCSPAYRARLGDGAGHVDLGRASLIHVMTASEDWQAWFDVHELGEVEIAGGLRFDEFHLAFEAAAAGLGVALGRRPLVDRELASGALVEVAAQPISGDTAYWLVSADGADQRSDLRAFKAWLLKEAQASDADAVTAAAGP